MSDPHIYEFRQFRLDPTEQLLLCNEVPVALTGKAFHVLAVLVRNSGHLIEKTELLRTVWGDTFVEEGNLAVTISMLRKALGDDRAENKFIETVARRGYRFLPTVCRVSHASEIEIPAARLIAPAVEAPALPVAPAMLPPKKKYLGSLALLAAVGLFVAIMAVVQLHARASRGAQKTARSIIIVPFAPVGSDQGSLLAGTSIAEDLIDKFQEAAQIEVRPASSKVIDYVNGQESISPIQSEPPMGAVLTGTIQVTPGRIYVRAKLLASNRQAIWSEAYEGAPAEIHQIEDKIEARVSMDLSPARPPWLKPNQARHDADAYRLYLEGRYFWNERTAEGFRRSIECFQQALLKDPSYADAYAGLADTYALLASYGVEPAKEAYPNAKAAALKALALDPSLAEAHTSLGMVAFYYEWNWREADREFKKAIELNPNYALVHSWNSVYLGVTGQMHQALQQAVEARELAPSSLISNGQVGAVYYWSRDYDEAISNYRRVLELDPSYAQAHLQLGLALAAQRNYSDATHEFEEARTLSGSNAYLDGLIGYTEAQGGERKAAVELLAQLMQRSHRQYVPAFSIALLYIGLGDHNRALDWLERAYQDRSAYMVYAGVDPLLDPVRADHRFVALMKLMGWQELRAENVGEMTRRPSSPAGLLARSRAL